MKWKVLFSWICFLSCTMLACQISAAQAAPMKEATTESKPTASPTVPTQVQGVSREVCAESLWVRVEPMGERRGFVSQGETVQVYAPVDGWSQIAAGKWRGLWVRESWLCQK
jgi:hypothetical protein